MELERESMYTMPLILGPLYRRDEARHHFRRISTYALQYPTGQHAVQRLLPKGCTADREPKVTVMFGYYDGVDFMADGGYREIVIQVSARFDGELDHVEGDFVLAMFLDDALPIIYGREQLGIPKLPAHISSVKIAADGGIRCEASLWGHALFSISMDAPSELHAPLRLLTARKLNKRPWLCWKYIPSLEGPPDADYPVLAVNDLKIDTLSIAPHAHLQFGDAQASEIAAYRTLLDTLATLEPTGPVQGIHLVGANTMRGDLSRRLR